ncbi:MAG: diaminopimelate epimerase [Bryobacteraceae bacterium]
MKIPFTKIPFTKAHGARNDFLLTPRGAVSGRTDLASIARAICERHTGAGADGWLLIDDSADADAAIELWNSDGSRSEISGNGTRCAAAWLMEHSRAANPIRISTGAGIKTLRLLERNGLKFSFEMNMGRVIIEELHAKIQTCDSTILNVGNPQCAIFVENFGLDWRALGTSIERDARFPHRTNVSFIRVLDRHTLDVRFFERGAGETMSSGTGSTGAAAAAVARGLAETPVEVRTPAGPLMLRWDRDEILLAGPAEIVTTGEFCLP